jgi:hypothetical protein
VKIPVPQHYLATSNTELPAHSKLLYDPHSLPVFSFTEETKRTTNEFQSLLIPVGSDDAFFNIRPNSFPHSLDVLEKHVAAIRGGAQPSNHHLCFAVDVSHLLHLIALFSVVLLVDANLIYPDKCILFII